MLDDLRMIHERDARDTLGAVEKQWRQLGHEFVLPAGFRPDHVYNVVFAGTGGAAAAAALAREWLDIGEPFEIVRGYDLPRYVDGDTLCIISSYVGDADETLSALEAARTAGAQVVVISHGGELAAAATVAGLPFLRLPDALASHFAIWSVVKALAVVCDAAGLTRGKAAELSAQSDWFAGQLAAWRPDVAAAQNDAKRIALELAGKSVVLYAGPRLSPAAEAWKSAINRNARHLAWCGRYPDFNHDEMLGWTRQPVARPFAVIDIRSDLEHPQVRRRAELSERLLSGMRPAPILVTPQGATLVRQAMYVCGLGDFASIYLALLGGINPAGASITETLNKELA